MRTSARQASTWAMASLRHREVGARGRGVGEQPKCVQVKRRREAAVAQRAPVEHQAGTGWPAFHGAAYVHLELMKCCRFHELQIDHVIGFGKALRSTLRNRELEGTTKSFCVVDGVRARQSRKTRDLVSKTSQ